MNWAWQAEAEPPPAQAVLATGAAARELHRLAAARLGQAGSDWLLAAHADLLLLCGSSESLPWCEGAIYAAPRPHCPSLWLPTALRPEVALDLLQQAIQQRHGHRAYLLLREPAQIVPLDRLQPASAELLAAIATRFA